MVSEGQFVGLDWNRIARLHSQVLVSKKVFRISFVAKSISFVCINLVQEKRNVTGVKALRLEKA